MESAQEEAATGLMAKGGDRQVVGVPEAFESFYRRELPRVLGVVMALTKSQWEAEEATQEAFLRAFRDWGRVGGLDGPAAWVRRVALNTAVSRWRRGMAEARALLRLERGAVIAPSDSEDDGLWKSVRALPRRQAQVVALTYVDGMDAATIGQTLGMAESTVRVHLLRARRALAQRFEGEP